MAETSTSRAQSFREKADQGDTEGFEALWLESIDSAPHDIDAFMAGIQALESQGNPGKAGLYLSMLVPALLERGLAQEAVTALHKMVAVAPREKGLRENLLAAYRQSCADLPHLEAFIERSGVIDDEDLPASAERLKTFTSLQEGAYLFHPAGWGAGRISSVDPVGLTIVIDFETKRGHRMAMEMARKVTETIPANDLRAMKVDRRAELEIMLEEDRAEVLRAALRSRRGKATQRELRDRLTDGLLTTKTWSRWWTKARKDAKGVPDISISPGANPTLELKAEEDGYPEACLRSLRMLDKDPAKIKFLRDLLKEARTHAEGEAAVAGVVASLAGPDGDGSELGLGARLSLSFLSGTAKEKFSELAIPEALRPERVAIDHHAVVAKLPEIPVAAHRVMALRVLRESGDHEWPELFRRVILRGEPETSEYCLTGLVQQGHAAEAQKILDVITEKPREYPLAFTWYLKSVAGGKLPDSVRAVSFPAALEKALILHNRLSVSTSRKTGADESKKIAKQLTTLFQAKKCDLVRRAFEASDEQEGRNLYTILRGNRSLPADARDRMLASMFRIRPELARIEDASGLAATDDGIDSGVIYTTEHALLEKRKEYEHLVNVLIPENAADIGQAASHGDLSENAEWAAALERRGHLSSIATEMGTDLDRARLIDASMQDGETVGIGSRVRVMNQEGVSTEFTILGPWEADADRNFISYLSPLGNALLSKAVGESADVEVPSGTIHYTVEDIGNGLEALLSEEESGGPQRFGDAVV